MNRRGAAEDKDQPKELETTGHDRFCQIRPSRYAISPYVCVCTLITLSFCVCSLSQHDDMRQANRNYIEICEFRSSFRKKRKRNVRRAQSAAEFDPRALSAANKRTLFK